jgi:hypothetical protein
VSFLTHNLPSGSNTVLNRSVLPTVRFSTVVRAEVCDDPMEAGLVMPVALVMCPPPVLRLSLVIPQCCTWMLTPPRRQLPKVK